MLIWIRWIKSYNSIDRDNLLAKIISDRISSGHFTISFIGHGIFDVSFFTRLSFFFEYFIFLYASWESFLVLQFGLGSRFKIQDLRWRSVITGLRSDEKNTRGRIRSTINAIVGQLERIIKKEWDFIHCFQR